MRDIVFDRRRNDSRSAYKNVFSGSNLRGDDLSGVDFLMTDLTKATLCYAKLQHAHMVLARMSHADLTGANLYHADLRCADLDGAILRDANLVGAILRDASLRYTDLRGAKLLDIDIRGANLAGADLTDADLNWTDLSPNMIIPHPSIDDLDQWGILHDDIYVYGFRSCESRIIIRRFANAYKVGKVYTAPWFSVDPESDCHPGIYFWPLLRRHKDAPLHLEHVYCRSRIVDCLRTKRGEWRTKRLEIISKGEIPCTKE